MKDNVDLTENMMFSGRNFDREVRDIFSFIDGHPWEKQIYEINSDDDFGNQRNKIIATGDKKEREKVEQYRRIDSMDTCDCCGASLIEIPWDRTIGVCKKCSEYYGFEKPTLWKFADDRNTIPLTI